MGYPAPVLPLPLGMKDPREDFPHPGEWAICALCKGKGEHNQFWVQYGAEEDDNGNVVRTFPICLRCGGYGVISKKDKHNTSTPTRKEIKHMLKNQHRDDGALRRMAIESKAKKQEGNQFLF